MLDHAILPAPKPETAARRQAGFGLPLPDRNAATRNTPKARSYCFLRNAIGFPTLFVRIALAPSHFSGNLGHASVGTGYGGGGANE